MTTTLSALDAAFLELEDADPGAHMHIGAILVFGPAERRRGAPLLAELRAHLDARLDVLPRYRQKLSATHVAGLVRPRWTPDPRFDISRHVRRAALPRPGGWEELLEWAEDFYAQRLDRTAPLWEMVVVEGLARGHWALATKTHHCLVDGVGAVDVAQALFGPAAGYRPAGVAVPGWETLQALWHGVGATTSLARHPGAVLRGAAGMAEWLLREEVRGAPHTSLNEPIGGGRRLRAATVDLDAIVSVREMLGGTINDIVLAGVAGGVRALLCARHEPLPAQGLRVMIPRDVRASEGHGGLGNRISALFVELPVDERDAVARYERIREATAAAKASAQAGGADALLRLAELTPPLVQDVFARPVWGTRLFNVTVTNVPGPRAPLSLLGSPLTTIYPLVPLAAAHAVGIAVTSYSGRLTFGINADHATVPDVDVLAEGIVEAVAELQRFCGAAGG